MMLSPVDCMRIGPSRVVEEEGGKVGEVGDGDVPVKSWIVWVEAESIKRAMKSICMHTT
jgi:hypothetical protein